MRRKVIAVALSATLFALCLSVEAQQPKQVPRVGLLLPWSPSSGVSLSFLKAFREGLHELGYVEGHNLAIEYRYADGASKRFPNLAAELAASSSKSGRHRDHCRATISCSEASNQHDPPLSLLRLSDPVAEGLVASLARPGGNITGLSQIGPELAGKRLELLKETFPKISRVAVLSTGGSQSSVAQFKETQVAAKAMGVQLQSLEVRSSDDFEAAFKTATTGRVGALIVLQSALINTHRTRIVELAAQSRLPTMFAERTHVESGGLMSYAPSFFDSQRRAGIYVGKILKGTKPAELPVEQPMKFEFIINLKTAKQIGVTIPQSVLYRADRVIK